MMFHLAYDGISSPYTDDGGRTGNPPRCQARSRRARAEPLAS